MGTKVVVDEIDNLNNNSGLATLNENLQKLADEFDKILYRDGSLTVEGDVDADSKRLLNLPDAVSGGEPVPLRQAGIYADAVAALQNWYPTKEEGEAATVEGEFFSYPDGAGGLVYAERLAVGSEIFSEAATKALVDSKVATADLTSTASGKGVDLVGNSARPAATRTVMAALDGTRLPVALLGESGREGTFKWVSGDQSAGVAADPEEGVYVPPASDATGASGAWVREVKNGVLDPRWFGAVAADGPDGEDNTGVQAALDFARALGSTKEYSVDFGHGRYSLSGVKLYGNRLKLVANNAFITNKSATGVPMFYIGDPTGSSLSSNTAAWLNQSEIRFGRLLSLAGAGHVFDHVHSFANSRMSWTYIKQEEPTKSIWSNRSVPAAALSGGRMYFVKFDGIYTEGMATHTVRLWDLYGTDNFCSENTFRILRPQQSGAEHWFGIENVGTASYCEGNNIKNFGGEVNNGGSIRLAGCLNCEITGFTNYDMVSTLSNHDIDLSSSGGGLASRRIYINGASRTSGTLGVGVYDIYLGDSTACTLDNLGPANVTPGYSVNLNSRPCRVGQSQNTTFTGTSLTNQVRFPNQAALEPFVAPAVSSRKIVTPVGATLTIAAGVVTATGSYHRIDTEGGAATDDLDTINGGESGMHLFIQAMNDARTVVVKDGTGNIRLVTDRTLDNTSDTLHLLYNSALSAWCEVGFADTGA